MPKVLGIEVKAGKFTPKGKTEEIEFNNINFYVLDEAMEMTAEHFAVGNRIDTIKIKNQDDVVLSIFGEQLTADKLKDFYNKQIDVLYNKYGNVSSIKLHK